MIPNPKEEILREHKFIPEEIAKLRETEAWRMRDSGRENVGEWVKRAREVLKKK